MLLMFFSVCNSIYLARAGPTLTGSYKFQMIIVNGEIQTRSVAWSCLQAVCSGFQVQKHSHRDGFVLMGAAPCFGTGALLTRVQLSVHLMLLTLFCCTA